MKFSHTEIKEVSSVSFESFPEELTKYLKDIFGAEVSVDLLKTESIADNEDVFTFFENHLPEELVAFNVQKCIRENKNLYTALLEMLSLVERRENTWEIDGDEKYKEEALEAITELSGARFQTKLFLGRGNAGHVFTAPGTEGYCLKYLHSPARQATTIEGEFILLGDVNRVASNFKALKVPQAHCLAKNLEGSKNFFTMEKVHGLTLEQLVEFPSKRLEMYSGFSLEALIALLKDQQLRDDLLDDLRKIHAAGIIHGDIHPRNIMFSTEGRLVLIDFGNGFSPVNVSAQAKYDQIEATKELDLKTFANSLDKTAKLLEEQILTN